MTADQALSIPVLLGSTRITRRSVHVARFILASLQQRSGIAAEMLDLAEYDFPIMHERPSLAKELPPGLGDFSNKLATANGVVIVAPEYKNGYPGVLKNALDYLDAGIFHRKPIGIATVSSGGFGGLNCLAQLRLVCLALGGIPLPVPFAVSNVQNAFDEQGHLRELGLLDRLGPFLDELIWYTRAVTRQLLLDRSTASS